MSRILIIAPENPFPPDSGGRLRTSNIVKILSNHFSIDFLTSTRNDKQPHNLCNLHLYEIKRTMSPKKCAFRSLLKFRNCSWFSHLDFDFEPQLLVLLKRHAYDFVLLESTMLGAFIPIIRGVVPNQKIIVNAHNFEADLSKQIIKNQSGLLRKLYFTANSYFTKSDEAKVVRHSNRIICCSDDDRLKFAALALENSERISVVPNFVQALEYSPSPIPLNRKSYSISLFGDMGYWPNINAAKHFYTNIFPYVRNRIPHATWHIVGRDCHPSIQKLVASDPGVVVTGPVPSIKDYISECDVSVVPLLEGSGTRLKILEAWAAGRPVVSTSIGSAGLLCEHGHNILISDNPSDFAINIISLLEDRDRSQTIANNAFNTLMTYYDISAVEKTLMAAVQSCTGVSYN